LHSEYEGALFGPGANILGKTESSFGLEGDFAFIGQRGFGSCSPVTRARTSRATIRSADESRVMKTLRSMVVVCLVGALTSLL